MNRKNACPDGTIRLPSTTVGLCDVAARTVLCEFFAHCMHNKKSRSAPRSTTCIVELRVSLSLKQKRCIASRLPNVKKPKAGSYRCAVAVAGRGYHFMIYNKHLSGRVSARSLADITDKYKQTKRSSEQSERNCTRQALTRADGLWRA